MKSFDGGPELDAAAVDRASDRSLLLRRSRHPSLRVEDGIAGARNDLSAAPSVDAANGAPTARRDEDVIVMSRADGEMGSTTSMFSCVLRATAEAAGLPPLRETAGDRGYYAAPAISPNGTDVYVVYNAFDPVQGQHDRAAVAGRRRQARGRREGRLGAWQTLHRGRRATRGARARTISRPGSSATTSMPSRRGPCGGRVERRAECRRLPGDRRLADVASHRRGLMISDAGSAAGLLGGVR